MFTVWIALLPIHVPVVQLPARVSSLLPSGATFVNKWIVIPHYHRVNVTRFCDTYKNKHKSSLLWCTCPTKNSRGLWPLREVRPYRPCDSLCNFTYHVRRTIWVLHRSGKVQDSVSFMIRDPDGGCSVSLKSSYCLTNWARLRVAL